MSQLTPPRATRAPLTQPRLGVAAAALVLVASPMIVSLFSWPTFGGWVSVGLMCGIPTAVVIGAFVRDDADRLVGGLAQPVRGVVLLAGTAVVGVVVGLVHWLTVGGGYSPPVPMLTMTIITSVLVTFLMVIVWGGWPFSGVRDRLVAAAALLVAVYVVNAVQFRLFFDFGFARGAPVYHEGLDPEGLFDAWDVTVFGVTMLAAMFLLLHLELWPLARVPALMRQPVQGLVWTALLVVLAAPVFWLGTRVAGLPDPVYLVRVPIPFVFGSVLTLNTLQGSLVARLAPRAAQPVRGLLGAVLAAVIGSVLAAGYRALMPLVTGALVSGAPTFDAELWLANVLLAVTFPLLAIHGDYFGLWPFAGRAARTAR